MGKWRKKKKEEVNFIIVYEGVLKNYHYLMIRNMFGNSNTRTSFLSIDECQHIFSDKNEPQA